MGVSASEWEQLSEEERRAWRALREQQKGESKARLERAMNASSAHEWAGVGLEMVFDLSCGASATASPDALHRYYLHPSVLSAEEVVAVQGGIAVCCLVKI